MSKESKESFAGIKDARSKREELVHIIIIAAILALGINLLASFLFSLFSEKSNGPFWSSVVLIVFALSYLFIIVLRARYAFYKFESVIPFDGSKKQVTVIPGYKLTKEIRRALDAAFLENEALELAWKSEPLVGQISPEAFEPSSEKKDEEISDKGNKQSATDSAIPSYFSVVKMKVPDGQGQSKSATILREVLEFVILEQLSYHLSEYFQGFDEQDNQIMEYNRKHVPELLLENRILSLLTTPPEDRAIFAKAKLPPESTERTIVSTYGSDGAMYTRFDLFLPKGTKVKRPAQGVLELENDRVALKLNIDYKGYNTNLPPDFAEAFLGVPRLSIQPLLVNIFLTTKIKTSALLRGSGWKYYQWIDSFAERLGEFSQFSQFLEKINWEAVMTHFHIKKNISKLRAKQLSGKKQNESLGDSSDSREE